ncbi:hypothetical protein HYW21_07105 [Candidatus Woesearchaeota archaeon]|nr:hypothetical protein [Candidatus Woesearchaeota archaeon]
MTKRYWLDTSLWRDFYEDRTSKAGNPLGKYAANLFIKILQKRDIILFSKSLIWELKKDYPEKDIYDMLGFLFMNNVLLKIEITKEEYLEAKRLAQLRNIPFVDCLNAIQARNHSALLISQDKHFHKNLSDIVKTMKPQDIT